VSRLGTPRDPIDLEGILVLAAIGLAFLVYCLIEYGIASAIARLFSRIGRKPPDNSSNDTVSVDQVPLEKIVRVTFYKRDELTTDLICCDVDLGETILFFHEGLDGWQDLVAHLSQLPGFDIDWYRKVVLPPFAENRLVAYAH